MRAPRARAPSCRRGDSSPCERACAVGLWPTTMAAGTSSGRRLDEGEHLLGVGPVEVLVEAAARVDRPCRPSTSSAVAAVRAAGDTRATCGRGTPLEARTAARRRRRRRAARARWRRAGPAAPAPGRSPRRRAAGRSPSWRGEQPRGCGAGCVACLRRHQPRAKAACRQRTARSTSLLGDDARRPDGRGRDHVDVDLLVGQGLEHGGRDAGVRLHAHPDQRDPGHVGIGRDARRAQLVGVGLGGLHGDRQVGGGAR